jgi:hypothetical protein
MRSVTSESVLDIAGMAAVFPAAIPIAFKRLAAKSAGQAIVGFPIWGMTTVFFPPLAAAFFGTVLFGLVFRDFNELCATMQAARTAIPSSIGFRKRIPAIMLKPVSTAIGFHCILRYFDG